MAQGATQSRSVNERAIVPRHRRTKTVRAEVATLDGEEYEASLLHGSLSPTGHRVANSLRDFICNDRGRTSDRVYREVARWRCSVLHLCDRSDDRLRRFHAETYDLAAACGWYRFYRDRADRPHCGGDRAGFSDDDARWHEIGRGGFQQ